MTPTQLLQKEIEEKKAELKRMEEEETKNLREEAIKPLSEFTDEEKIQKFESIYKSALYMLKEKEDKGWSNEDDPHYTWEEVMQLLARDSKKFWKYYNSIGD